MAFPENTNLGALTAGVTSLFAGVGLLTATGVLGRLERNEPDLLTGAVILALVGSAMLVIAGLKITSGTSEIFATIVGTGLVIVGIGWAMAGGIRTAGDPERPGIQVSIGTDLMLDGKVTSGNLASHKRLAVLVEGLKPDDSDPKHKGWHVFTLAQYYVGPDGDGNAELPIKFPVPKEYTALGIKAWSDSKETCGKYPRRVLGTEFKVAVKAAGTGCVVLPVTAPTPAPKQVLPEVHLKWEGGAGASRRVRLTVTSPSLTGDVVVLAAARRKGRTRQLLNSVHTAAGAYRAVTRLRVGTRYTRICAYAYVKGKAKGLTRLRACPLPASLHAGKSGAGLRRPARQ